MIFTAYEKNAVSRIQCSIQYKQVTGGKDQWPSLSSLVDMQVPKTLRHSQI